MHPAGRALIAVWIGLLLLAGSGAVLLWRLGPPPSAKPAAQTTGVAQPLSNPVGVPAATEAKDAPARRNLAAPSSQTTATPAATAVSPPVPELSEPAADFPGRTLPVTAADGRAPATAYSARAGTPAKGPQVAILLEGLGLSDALDREAVETLPPAISLAVSPYADTLDRPGDTGLLDQARRNGHELFLSLPMEPAGSPADSEGSHAMSLGLPLAEDHESLLWALSRFAGYVGVTNALGGLRGDRFASSSAFGSVAEEIRRRGLLYVDAGLAPHEQPAIEPPGAREADLTIDENPNAADIEARLSRLEQIALGNGAALGVAGPLRPATLERLRSWSRTLHERGINLVPVSALPTPHPPVQTALPAAAVPPPATPAPVSSTSPQ